MFPVFVSVQYLVLLTIASGVTDFVATAISTNKDVYRDAKLDFINKSGVEAERNRRLNEFRSEYEHELNEIFKLHFDHKLVDMEGDGVAEEYGTATQYVILGLHSPAHLDGRRNVHA